MFKLIIYYTWSNFDPGNYCTWYSEYFFQSVMLNGLLEMNFYGVKSRCTGSLDYSPTEGAWYATQSWDGRRSKRKVSQPTACSCCHKQHM